MSSFLSLADKRTAPDAAIEAVIFETETQSIGVNRDDFFEAAENGDFETVELWLQASGAVNIRNSFGETALHVVGRHKIEMAQRLVQAGANLAIKDDLGNTPVDLARVHARSRREEAKALYEFLRKQPSAVERSQPIGLQTPRKAPFRHRTTMTNQTVNTA